MPLHPTIPRVILLVSLWLGLAFATPPAGAVDAGAAAEWLPALDILVHEPAEELFFGVIHPGAALFARPFSAREAVEEHRAYVRLLESRGATVHRLADVLLEGTIDADGRAVEGPALDRLRAFALEFIGVDASRLPADHPAAADPRGEAERTLAELDPRELVRVILLRPTIELRSTGSLNTGLVAGYTVDPVMNLYFTRDQVITTPRGVVIGRMNSEQRRVETRIVRFALDRLGVSPLLEIAEPGRLEGGDFIPAGSHVFIGQGLRTNAFAIAQLLRTGGDGPAPFEGIDIIVVSDAWQNQDQMHLDTYFNIVAERTCLLAEQRMSTTPAGTPRARDELMRLTAVVHRWDPAAGAHTPGEPADFETLLGRLGYRVIGVSSEDQLAYGVNVLTTSANRAIGVDGVSDDLKARLRDAGVDVEWIDFSALTGGYGACHCTTQVLRRG